MFLTCDHLYEYYQTEAGYEIRGLFQPANEGTIPAYQWALPRLIFRTPWEGMAKVGDIVIRQGKRFILGLHDENPNIYRVFRLVEATDQVSWQRNTTVVDPVTKLERETTPAELGPIWVAIEQLGRLDTDRNVHIRENPRLCITSADVLLNDTVDGQMVRRITPALGINILELG